MVDLILYVALATVWGLICYAIGKDKTEYPYLWGFLGVFGVIIVVILSNQNSNKKVIVSKTQKEIDIEKNKYSRLEDLYELKRKGILTQEEFEEEKMKILKRW